MRRWSWGTWGRLFAAAIGGLGCGGPGGAVDSDVAVDSTLADDTAVDSTLDSDAAVDSDAVDPDAAVDSTLDAAVDPDAAVDSSAPPSRPVLNELRCKGSEFVELANPGPTPAPIAGWTLIEDGADPDRRWTFPNDAAPIPPGGHLAVAADLDDVPLGLPGGLSCGADTILLLDPSGAIVDSALAREAAIPEGSWGRVPDGLGELAPNTPTPGAANRALVLQDGVLFDPLVVHTIDLTLDDAALAGLAGAPYEHVPATFALATADGRRYGPWPVGLRQKGKWGSFRALPDKSAFKVKLDWQDDDRHLEGLTTLTLNNLVQDPSALHEVLAYTLFRAVGVPAPEVGYAWVRVNGDDYGLYTHIETVDDRLVRRALPGTTHLYEGEYGTDVRPEMVDAFDRDMGDDDRADLRAFAAAIERAPEGAGFLAALGGTADLAEMTKTWAVERWIGHWDGYSGNLINNYYLHADARGVFRMIPWGADQVFADRLPLGEPNGVLFRKCFADPSCRALYVAAVIDVTAAAQALDLVARGEAIAAVIDPFLERDPKRAFSGDDTAYTRDVMNDFLANRGDDFPEWLGCAGHEDDDGDGDGFRCVEDCDDDDRATHPGAGDACDDGIDQDCTGWADDGLGCADGDVVTRGDHRYLLSDTPRTRAEAAEHCAAWAGAGGGLALIDSASEAGWLARKAPGAFDGRWLGLDDRAADGDWRTRAGRVPRWTAWADGEPNGGDGEACVLATGGGWADYPCDERFRALCETACAPDGDGDGWAACEGDGDDDDRDLSPDAVDLCEDGVDQDQNGRADDGPGCPLPCTRLEIAGATYRFCEDRMDWLAAEAACATFDMRLVSTVAYWETRRVHDFADTLVGFGDGFWIGLDDRAEEGAFVWADGTPLEAGDVSWDGGQPDDYFGEDCVALWPWVAWNDYPCEGGAALPFVCESACDPVVDGDGDGAFACAEDCDDGDRAVHPGADERCGDGRDDDCDGETDEDDCR